MKHVTGIQLALNKDEGDDFSKENISEFILGEISNKLSDRGVKMDELDLSIDILDHEKYDEYKVLLMHYYENAYSKKFKFDDKKTDDMYGSIDNFILSEDIRNNRVDKKLSLNDKSSKASIIIFFKSDSNKLDIHLRVIADDLKVNYFKYMLN